MAERKKPFLESDNAHNPLATDTTNLKKKNQIKIISLVLFLAGETDKRVGGCETVKVSDVFSLYRLIPDNGTSHSVCQCLFTHK